jgi:aminopeptidase YwaD
MLIRFWGLSLTTAVVIAVAQQICYSQQLLYAKQVIDTLCSDAMKGRGYVANGDRRAADYLAAAFEKSGLKKYSKNYFQPFTTPVNTFPGTMSLVINGTKLKAGEDFLIEPGSPGIAGKFSTELLTADDLLSGDLWIKKIQKAASRFVVVNAIDKTKYSADQMTRINDVISFLKYSKENPSKGTLILTTEKLTWSGSTELFSKPCFTIKASSISEALTSVEISAENKFLKNYQTQNVIGYIEGTNKDSLLVFTAHYDHLGMMGTETMFPGANDNASGVSLLLNFVKYFSANKPEYTVVFMAFAAEEIGLIGSKYFTEHPLFPLKKIKFLLNFDLAGTGEDGIQVVNGKNYQQKFDLLTKLNNQDKLLKQIKIRGEACNSDHCMFHNKGVPCFFIYTLGGIQAYHDIYDRPETLPLTEYQDYFTLLVKFIDNL